MVVYTTLYCSNGGLRDSGGVSIVSSSLQSVPHHVLGARREAQDGKLILSSDICWQRVREASVL